MLPVNEAPSDMRTLLYFMYGLLVRTCGEATHGRECHSSKGVQHQRLQ